MHRLAVATVLLTSGIVFLRAEESRKQRDIHTYNDHFREEDDDGDSTVKGCSCSSPRPTLFPRTRLLLGRKMVVNKASIVRVDKDTPLGYKLLTAGTAACIADFATFPLDTAKVRLQIQGEGRSVMTMVNGALVRSTTAEYHGLIGTITTIARQEGFRCLYNGLSAGLQRQMCFASVRLGLYDTVKDKYQRILDGPSSRAGSLNIGTRVAAGITTGALAVLLAQPTDVVKVRFQAHLRGKGGAPRYPSTLNAYRTIATQEGVRGLWKGCFPNVTRNAIVNVSEIVCYDIFKELILKYDLMKDGIPCHFTSAVIAGFCTTVVASPVDVVKTRYMNSAKGEYKGAVDCALRMFSQEGPTAFYKGFTPSFCRLVSWNIVMWISYEQIKLLVQNVRCTEEA